MSGSILPTVLLLLSVADPGARSPFAAIVVGELPTTTQFRLSRVSNPVKPHGTLTAHLLARDAINAIVGPDGLSLFVANGGRGSRIVTLATNERWRLSASYVQEAAFAPTGARLAVIDEDQSLVVYSLAGGNLERRIPGPFVKLGFVSPNRLLMYDGCSLKRIDVTHAARLSGPPTAGSGSSPSASPPPLPRAPASAPSTSWTLRVAQRASWSSAPQPIPSSAPSS